MHFWYSETSSSYNKSFLDYKPSLNLPSAPGRHFWSQPMDDTCGGSRHLEVVKKTPVCVQLLTEQHCLFWFFPLKSSALLFLAPKYPNVISKSLGGIKPHLILCLLFACTTLSATLGLQKQLAKRILNKLLHFSCSKNIEESNLINSDIDMKPNWRKMVSCSCNFRVTTSDESVCQPKELTWTFSMTITSQHQHLHAFTRHFHANWSQFG